MFGEWFLFSVKISIDVKKKKKKSDFYPFQAEKLLPLSQLASSAQGTCWQVHTNISVGLFPTTL